MAALGTILGAIAALAFLLQWRIEKHPFLLKIFIWAIPLPYVAIFAGWTVAEVGRQPWIVHGMMRTSTAVSPVPAYSVIISLIAFTAVYTLLGAIDIHLLRKHAMQGPEAIPEDAPETH